MRNDELDDGEWLSALADGQLQGEEFAQALGRLGSSGEALSQWHAYHVAGDVLRCADLADCGRDQAFVARLRTRMAEVRPFDQASGDMAMDGVWIPAPQGRPQAVRQSANDAVVRWKWLAGVASVLAVVVFGWNVSRSPDAAQLARAPSSAGAVAAAGQPASGEPPVMLRDPRLDELLAAHRQFGGTSALQMPAGFLRNATFEQTGR